MSITNSKKIKKNEKPAHILFLYHILTIQVDKQGLHTFERKTGARRVKTVKTVARQGKTVKSGGAH